MVRERPPPWKPPKKLVVLGIYRNVRNPMVIGVWCVLVRGVDPVSVRGVVGVVPRILYGVYVYHSIVGEKGFGKSELFPFSSLKCI
jgi:protein-S-isoprenylcysteine O-methyltransferase Ste14